MSSPPRPLNLLVVSGSDPLPAPVEALIAAQVVEPARVGSCQEARDATRLTQADAVLVCSDALEASAGLPDVDLQLLADALMSHRRMGLVLSGTGSDLLPGDNEALTPVAPGVSADELWGRLATLQTLRPQLRRMEDQVSSMQRLGKKLNEHLVEVDRELRLASRLQRDFLPKALPELADVSFAALYRPATWVSGDVYDVRRLDETHLGFLLADAVGHGVAAGLLTMFIRQAVRGKRIQGGAYEIVPPNEVMARLNYDLEQQELPHCQFVTACYGVIDVRTHEVTFSRGGHPHPIHVRADGTCVEVHTVGGLLGVLGEEDFPSATLSLAPGEKFVIYSDGLEDEIIAQREPGSDGVAFTPSFLNMIKLPGEACLAALSERLDNSEGSLEPADDQTCLIVERAPTGG